MAAETTLPRTIGRYEVLGRLAIGGMAEILLARVHGPSGFERPVVIKRILPTYAQFSEFVDMFLDEARIAAQIRHPNVVQVLELGRDGEELYLVMEYLEGESAASLMRRATVRGELLDPFVCAHAIAQAAAGLHAAHELTDTKGRPQNVVHRDVSPQNVFVTYEGSVKVLDFGIAKAADRISRTEAGMLKGKFDYMSPEQAAGEPMDRRSDIFSLGIVLYETSTGHRLFKRSTQVGALKAVINEPIVPPSMVVAGYPSRLEAICMRALERRPDDRYATVADMRRDLVAFLREAPTHALPDEQLATMMRTLFRDRIAQKQEMLATVRSGSTLDRIPIAEVDSGIELPDVEKIAGTIAAAAMSKTEAGTTPYAVKRSRTARLVAAVGAAVLAAATVALLVTSSRDGSAAPPSTATDPGAPLAAAPPAAEPPAARPEPPIAGAPAPAQVLLRVESTPTGASVSVDGTPAGTTPIELALPRGEAPIAVRLSRDGYFDLTERVTPRVDQLLRLSMRARPRRRGGGASEKAAPTKSDSDDRDFRRFD